VTNVRLTFAARQRFPDIGTSHGTSHAETGKWLRVEWPGDRTTWLRAEDLEPVTPDDQQPQGEDPCP
jgi:hypothetical protein